MVYLLWCTTHYTILTFDAVDHIPCEVAHHEGLSLGQLAATRRRLAARLSKYSSCRLAALSPALGRQRTVLLACYTYYTYYTYHTHYYAYLGAAEDLALSVCLVELLRQHLVGGLGRLAHAAK